MKRLILSLIAVSVFFLGLGSLVETTGARFRSDDKALALIAKARQAIGGDAAIANVQSMLVVGRTTKTWKVDGVEKSHQGETEIAIQFPDKLMRSTKITDGDGTGDRQELSDLKVIVMGDAKDHSKVRVDPVAGEPRLHKKVVIKKDDGTEQVLTDAEADKWIAEHPGMPGEKRIIIDKLGDGTDGAQLSDKMILRREGGDGTFTTRDGKTFDIRIAHDGAEGLARHNDMLRFALSLLLTSPKGMDVEYSSGGEADLDGTNCNIVVASFGGQSYKLFLDASSYMPVAINFMGIKMERPVKLERSAVPPPADGSKDVMFFKHKPETAEFLVRFSDYRSVNGVQLPFRWSQTVAGAADETFDVASYEINPANIAEKLQQPRTIVRMKKPEIQ